ncbi:hypothetical protein C9374_012935 [Naegleria lovaniensis]|uniref:Uncharacterized protein n=1 Tax=Naegleria lovaniensis TaxID=51637 RepID=A0AA88G755_NAELO|nr:uncharacterized protein C9374_012935 [Naegleria lovaniensis]KAG2372992.1 hypothetical protein C9374_012935 [Naegleria lovaniensis]
MGDQKSHPLYSSSSILTSCPQQEVHLVSEQGANHDHNPPNATDTALRSNCENGFALTPNTASPLRCCTCCCIHRKRRSSNGTSSNGGASNDGVVSPLAEKGPLTVLINNTTSPTTSISGYVTQLAKYPRWETTTNNIYHYESVLSVNLCPPSPLLSSSNYDKEMASDEDFSNVVLVLDASFCRATSAGSELLDLLKMKMRSTPQRAFSMNFEHVATLGKSSSTTSTAYIMNHPLDHQFYCPCDIKISYNCHVILVSDMGNRRIQVLDLATLRLRASINIAAKHLCIESNYDSRRNDALLVTCNDHCVYKYDLQQLIEESTLSSTNVTNIHSNTKTTTTTTTSSQSYNYIWRSGTPNVKGKALDQFNQPSGMAVWYGKSQQVVSPSKSNSSQNLVFVCDCNNNRIQVVQAHDGKVISTIGGNNADQQQKSIQFKGPWDIQINEHSELVVCEVDTHRIQVLRRITCDEKRDSRSRTSNAVSNNGSDTQEHFSYISTKSFGITKGYTSTFNHPRGVAIDKTREHIILCDQDNNRIVVLHEKTGQVKRVFGSRGTMNGQFFKPHGICLNERTGELLVADYLNHRIQIFK